MGERNFYNIDGRVISTPSKELSPEEKVAEEKLVERFMNELNEAGKASAFGEMFKTDEEKIAIRNFNKYIKEEAVSLGVENLRQPLPIKKIHFVAPSGYNNQFPESNEGVRGSYHPDSDAIYVKRNKDSDCFKVAHVILHEMIHSYSAIRYDFDSKGLMNSNKVGYNTTKSVAEGLKETLGESADTEKFDELFLAFNEGVTDLMAKEILDKHKDDLIKDLELNEDDIEKNPLKYHGSVYFVNWIINKIVEKSNENRDDVWKRFKVGLLTGSIMHLREIEKNLGPGSLRIIAKAGNSDEDSLALKEFIKNYDKNK